MTIEIYYTVHADAKFDVQELQETEKGYYKEFILSSNSLSNEKNMDKLVSIIIPVYNSPDLFASLDSVIMQNYECIQMIVLDDKSDNFVTSEVRKYLAKKCRKNITEIIVKQNQKNIGTVKNMNQGFRLSKGKYIFTLAGDDLFYDENVIGDWVSEFERTGAGIITAKREKYDATLSVFCGIEPSDEKIDLIKSKEPEELFEEMCSYNFIFGCCTARSKSFLNECGLFDENYRLIDDYPMHLQYLRKGYKIHFFDRVVIKYRGGGISAASNYDITYDLESIKILRKEILPYTRNPKEIKIRFREWRRVQLKCKYEAVRALPIQRLKVIVFYIFHYPEDIGYLVKKYCIRGNRKC